MSAIAKCDRKPPYLDGLVRKRPKNAAIGWVPVALARPEAERTTIMSVVQNSSAATAKPTTASPL